MLLHWKGPHASWSCSSRWWSPPLLSFIFYYSFETILTGIFHLSKCIFLKRPLASNWSLQWELSCALLSPVALAPSLCTPSSRFSKLLFFLKGRGRPDSFCFLRSHGLTSSQHHYLGPTNPCITKWGQVYVMSTNDTEMMINYWKAFTTPCSSTCFGLPEDHSRLKPCTSPRLIRNLWFKFTNIWQSGVH